jgi:7-cyano-7-deazaguanine synthase in queuosine biosynthesis
MKNFKKTLRRFARKILPKFIRKKLLTLLNIPTRKRKERLRYLLNFSGGLDSTYTLYKHLIDKPNEKLLVHHCVIINHQNRWQKESKSVKKIIKWISKNVSDNFTYVETMFDSSQLEARCLDGQIVAFMNGVMFRKPRFRSIKFTYLNTPRDEYDRLGDHLDKLNENFKSIRSIPQESLLKKQKYVQKIKPIYLLKHTYKRQMIEEMPDKLVRLTWSCRTPKRGKRCIKCHTCKQLYSSQETTSSEMHSGY